MIENRVRILEAARRVYSTFGWRGATTRRIAEAAGVNEVTIFRQFGNKEALLGAVMSDFAAHYALPPFPAVPLNPEQELTLWAVAHHERLCAMREMIRQMMGQVGERPEVGSCAANGPQSAAALLREYVVCLGRNGWLDVGTERTPAADAHAGVAMLMGALFADAMGRDFMPEMFPGSAVEGVGSYVRLFLRALGTRKSPQLSADNAVVDAVRGITVDAAQ
ncbi:MAG: TetR/AcrR family transcriptional regulator [Phycisphaerae bacterium]|nr:TetR/AcrR family transcriptional regulator [Gemmatimonadaceae bacterium]